ncbi:MAG: hypothetical protein Q3986_06830 [Akkermansia sp.]|nr:hypothetical protein [Akkermansia sp.]
MWTAALDGARPVVPVGGGGQVELVLRVLSGVRAALVVLVVLERCGMMCRRRGRGAVVRAGEGLRVGVRVRASAGVCVGERARALGAAGLGFGGRWRGRWWGGWKLACW